MSLNFQHIKGDTFEAVNFQINENGDALDLAQAVIKMQLRKECGGVIALSLTSVDNDGLTIVNTSSGEFKINEQIININSGNYLYDIEITFRTGVKKTWISGQFNVTCDITR
jgi:hypothetical protein